MTIWLVSREYAGIAEAGGVKNVAASLCESLARHGHKVTLFIPFYGCTNLQNVENCCQKEIKLSADIIINDKTETVNFFTGSMNGVHIVFISHKAFSEKKAVYTYTHEDEVENSEHKQGEGHQDVNFLNALFQKAVIKYGENFCRDSIPDIIHCQDAPAAMVPVYAHFSSAFKKTKFAVTIHNAGPGYHHNFCNIEEAVKWTGLNKEFLLKGSCPVSGSSNNSGEAALIEPFILAGLNSCITTVSPQYAREIIEDKTDTAGLSKAFRENKISITGITNGIDFSRYDTKDIKKSLLPFAYNPETLDLEGKYKGRNLFLKKYASKNNANRPECITQYGYIDFSNNKETEENFVYIAYHGRVVHQKGIEVMCEAAEKLLYKGLKVKFIFAGQGAPELEEKMTAMAKKFDGSIVYLKGYDKKSARLSIAAADFSLHPSWFEPCGLEDFIAQTFGTIPVAHGTGGLQKIVNEKTGYLYSPNTSDELCKILEKLIVIVQEKGRKALEPMIKNASDYIHENYSWDKVALEYEKLYKSL